MKTFLLSLFIFLSISLSAQDWFPFPVGQRSYFEQTSHTFGFEFPDTVIQSFKSDSIRIDNNKTITYFNFKNPDISPCYNDLKDFITNLTGYNPYQNIFNIDSIVSIQDSIWMYYPQTSNPILLIPSIEVGDSFTSVYSGTNYNKLKFTCDTKTYSNIFGVPDSIKSFSIETYNDDTLVSSSLSNQTLKISKNHGFINFFPYNQPLIGFKTDLISAGFVEPNLQDYFNLQQGDILIWKYHHDPWDFMDPETISYHKDSITSVISNSDSVLYQITRTYQDGSQYSIYKKYLYANLKGLFVNTSSLISVAGIKGNGYDLFPLDEKLIYSTSPIYIDNQNLINKKYSYIFVDKINDCQFNGTVDFTEDIKMNTKYGIYHLYQGGWGSSTWSIEGSVINGIPEGASWKDLVTSIEVNKSIPEFKIYPNPANSKSIINIEGKELIRVEILNLQGQVIDQPNLMYNKLNIDLAQGIYFLKAINKEGKSAIEKLIVN